MKLMMGRRFPRAMGMDFAGVVEAVGPGVTGFAHGHEVLGQVPMMKPGSFAETAITTSNLVIKKPASLSFPAAAALPTVGVTAWRADRRRQAEDRAVGFHQWRRRWRRAGGDRGRQDGWARHHRSRASLVRRAFR
jgi:NADPH:quinone reductase-like Zn-dependent oxidoreductase